MFHVEQPVEISPSKCPVCGHSDHLTYLELKDYFLTKEDFSLVKCNYCGLIATNPQPKLEEIGRYYNSGNYISHATNSISLVDRIYNLIRKRTLASKISLIKKHTNGNHLLDIGCATGVFLNYCSQHNFTVEGVEPDEKARNYACEHFNLNVKDLNNLNNLKENSFDIITMWHVLEHVNDINERLSVVWKLLKDDGIAIIALPNPQSYDSLYYKEYWAAYDVPRHLYHFSQAAFNCLAKMNHFNMIKTVPMFYDSFYISLLSEKYKNGKGSPFKAIYRGCLSNIHAMANHKNYSSLIYILKKG